MESLRILLIEDSAIIQRKIDSILQDGEKPVFALDKAGSLGEGFALAQNTSYDAVLLDLGLPDSEGLGTLERFRKEYKGVPVVVLTATVSDDTSALSGIRQGAQDYLSKEISVYPQVLRRSLLYAIERGRMQREREELIGTLQEALENIRTLNGLLPICAYCHKIRDDEGYWQQIESYISRHTPATFTHTYCEECLQEYHPDIFEKFQRKTAEEL